MKRAGCSVPRKCSATKFVRQFLFWTVAFFPRGNGSAMAFVRPLGVSSITGGCFKGRCSYHVFDGISHAADNRQDYDVLSERRVSARARINKSIGYNRSNKSAILACTLLTWISSKPAAAFSSATSSMVDLTNSYHLSRILFLRMLAVVYIAAFSVARNQNKGLIGDRGITPARKILDNAQKRGEAKSKQRKEWVQQRNNYAKAKHLLPRLLNRCKCSLSDSVLITSFRDKFWYRTDGNGRPLPTLLWLARDRSKLNPWLDNLSEIGLFLALIMLATGSANVPLILGLYTIQRSLMAVGGVWYGYGWEPQLAELTFLTLFLVPLFSMHPFFGFDETNGPHAVPKLVIWAVRFYLFKIMMGAGLIKLKSSDPKWKPGNMSAMDYFYETQPVPNPLTRFYHSMPKLWHRFEVWSNHFVELVAPFLLLLPFRNLRLAGGLIQIVFQFVLISSGNLSFLNWLTIVPAITCLDDQFLLHNIPNILRYVALGTPKTHIYLGLLPYSNTATTRAVPITRQIVSIACFLMMAQLNIPVVRNLLARRQFMNGSFDKLRLANTYGAFGTVAEERVELIVESACNINGPWKRYEFKVKPGDIYRRPPWISPYHYRLDWQMWIASQLGNVDRSPWMYSFLLKLLNQERDVMDLIKEDPWKRDTTIDTAQPKYIRIEKYKYKFNSTGTKGPYWTRERTGRFFPRHGVMSTETLNEMIR